MQYRYLGNPCRNFCFLGAIKINDPKDGREKVVLSSFVSGETGGLVFIDTESREGEWIELPGDEGAWALFLYNNEKLLVGTCGTRGYLHCLDLKSRTWAEPLRDENETYIWNLVQGSDGMVYGGTYPGCVLLRYNPQKHILENLGKVSEHEGNMYSRMVYGDVPGKIFINCGMKKSHVAAWDIETCTVKEFGKEGAIIKEANADFVCTETRGELDFYHPYTLEPLCKDTYASKLEKLLKDRNITDDRIPSDKGIGRMLKLKEGKLFGIRGQEYFILNKNDRHLKLERIPVEAPATGILTITSDPYNRIWGSSNFGQTIFCYNTDDGKYWNSSTVTNNGGEVYGMRWAEGKLFMSCYAGGDHVVYDPEKPWDQINNINPKTLKSVAPELIRPHAKSIIGPDGAFWTGWTARYGVYGGGLSRVDTGTLEVDSWYDPVPGQNIESLAAGDKYLYFTTNGWGNGLPEKVEPFYLCVWDTNGRIVWKMKFSEGEKPGKIGIIGSYGLISINDEIRVFDCRSMEFINTIKVGGHCSCIIEYNEDIAAVFCGKDMYFINPANSKMEHAIELPGYVGTATIGPKGEIYFACKTKLYKVV
ncbi:MAG: hypothetical protein HPY74_02060 [Firmicutes bacterium]|nr:hypothetical protein [Bacillota bacterium]